MKDAEEVDQRHVEREHLGRHDLKIVTGVVRLLDPSLLPTDARVVHLHSQLHGDARLPHCGVDPFAHLAGRKDRPPHHLGVVGVTLREQRTE